MQEHKAVGWPTKEVGQSPTKRMQCLHCAAVASTRPCAVGWPTKDIDPDGAQYLIQAIVDCAAKDYLHAPEGSSERQDAVRFFLSDWFECLTGFDGRATLRNLQAEREKKHRRKRGRGR